MQLLGILYLWCATDDLSGDKRQRCSLTRCSNWLPLQFLLYFRFQFRFSSSSGSSSGSGSGYGRTGPSLLWPEPLFIFHVCTAPYVKHATNPEMALPFSAFMILPNCFQISAWAFLRDLLHILFSTIVTLFVLIPSCTSSLFWYFLNSFE